MALIENLVPRWYDIFLHLGIDRSILDKCLEEYPYDDRSALLKVIAVWLQRVDPPPSWRALVDVLQNILLEGKLAVEIKKKYCRDLLLENEGALHVHVPIHVYITLYVA